MKSLKKIMSAAIAAATLLAGTTFTVSADYDSYDVNRDGRVSPADLVQLNRYLCGGDSVTNYNLFDVNRSLTVDAADAECLKLRVLGKDYSTRYYSRKTQTAVAFPPVSGFTPSASSSSSEGRSYIKYSYKNSSTSTYTLTPTKMTFPDASLNPGVETRTIIDTDDRKASEGPENSGIVYLETKANNAVGIGTGFIVGDHQIATAAHNVYDDEKNNWYQMTIKTYDDYGYLKSNTLTPVEAHIPESYDVDIPDMYDYALITVKEDLSGYVHFSLGTPYNVSVSDYINVPIYITGSPTDRIFQGGAYRLYSAEGRIMNNPTDYTDIICYDVDMTGGQSGSPVYTITKIGNEYIYTAIAINFFEYAPYGPNCGSMITNYHLQFYKNNPNAKYEAN